MKILAVITARGGSKRLPRKNIRILNGRHLISWSIDIAKDIYEIIDILVSTDDPEIAEIARSAGALVPWLRPAELSSDNATSALACIHALDWYEANAGLVDGLLLLQPTSPLRSRTTVLRGIQLFQDNGQRPIVGLSPTKSHPFQCFRLDEGRMRPFFSGNGLNLRSQDLPAAYEVNGSFYLIAPEDLRRMESFYSDVMVPLVIEAPEESLDIDTEWDWKMAEAALDFKKGD